MFKTVITAYSEMDNANEPESSSTEARMERMVRMIELLTARLELQHQPPHPPPVQPEDEDAVGSVVPV